ncbi:MAG TPA: urea ABC transporter permease subunit UrtC [Xanthobacteraceae bacterium]|nr:urea ABC transporter permease subunit UrtC [Xanthobacteraceae bacterium]
MTQGPLILRLLDGRGKIFVGVVLAMAVVVPLLNLLLPPSNPFHVPTYVMVLIGKYLCYALLALSVDLVWGYAGILSLGHGAFFALGGYAMGMYLMRQIGTRGVYAHPVLPDFMVFLNYKELPWFWYGFDWFIFAAFMVVAVPGVLAFVFGWFAFRSRVTGVYLSIITQALTFALMLAFFRNNFGFGGNNGLTDFKDILGFNVQAQGTRATLFALSAIFLVLGYLLCRWMVTSKFGKVLIAVRDQESRARFIGYRVENYKLVAFVVSACLAGIAGALYVPQVGIINPSEFSPANSIEIIIWVAVGGRGTLVGAALGAFVVNYAKTVFTGGLVAPFWLFGVAVLALAAYLVWKSRIPALAGIAGGIAAAFVFSFVPGPVGANAALIVAAIAFATLILTTRADAAGVGAGALLVFFFTSPFTGVPLSQYWLFALGGLFVFVTLLMPKGIVGTVSDVLDNYLPRRKRKDGAVNAAAQASPAE